MVAKCPVRVKGGSQIGLCLRPLLSGRLNRSTQCTKTARGPFRVMRTSQTFQENVSPSFDRDESTMFRVRARDIRCRRTLFTHGYEEPHFVE